MEEVDDRFGEIRKVWRGACGTHSTCWRNREEGERDRDNIRKVKKSTHTCMPQTNTPLESESVVG